MTEITLNNVIVHELLKEAKKPMIPGKRMKFRDTTLDLSSEIVLKLINEINELYGKKGNSAYYGVFKKELTERGPVPDAIENYTCLAKPSSQDFIDLSVGIMNKLADEAEKQLWSSGGVIVFADYVRDGVNFFLITMIKQKEGIRLSSKLEPELLEQLDLTKINQAARINFDKFLKYQNSSVIDKQDLSYLSFISTTTQKTASGYFILALGCDKGITSNNATKSLPTEVMRFFGKHSEIKHHARDFKSDVINYINHQFECKKTVKLSDISAMAYEHMTYVDEQAREKLSNDLVTYLNSEEIRIPVEFNVSRSGLNQLLNIKYKGDGYSFNFEKALLGTTADADICYNSENGSLTFTKLPKDAVQDIEHALKEKLQTGDGDDK
ncbi:nucleoid-associated protein [Salmonella enterica]|uniref:nucleoid-associated protein n=1 Tax=Salmonella enterica TaxID=28901 RepID=UPI00142A86E1|nr:nucleoid-associated protein [Salmonella enterica]EDJ8265862.1 nucleoid-associated protein [Salmonella enterica subsp. enterica serovar Poona]EGQ1986130.1 nucleoid-associated protein [Salmonella enterica subsp. enterica serovar Oranienburg]EGR7199212.1 nucleoid-associated protein [Salmonella enterica subsp. enterica serovar Muenchen]EKC4535803.1 nucleoid-associated protein [Salmonella enterica subsp. enterica]EDI1628863.1 nucleoid-associated protein [Salmonella enterica]